MPVLVKLHKTYHIDFEEWDVPEIITVQDQCTSEFFIFAGAR